MEKLDKVIVALERCGVAGKGCNGCPYDDGIGACNTRVVKDALTVIRDLKSRLDASKAARLELGRRCAELAESEPVVHAHWVDRPDGAYKSCRNCCSGVPTMQRPLAWLRCPVCGAHMDEEVAE